MNVHLTKMLETNAAINRDGGGFYAASRTPSPRHAKIIVRSAFALAALALNFSVVEQSRAAVFTNTGSLSAARAGHTATLLPNGTVLVAGGYNGTDRLARCELYNPATGLWAVTGALATGRTRHTATLLPNGLVLAAAGGTGNGQTATCELYDPASGTWTTTRPLAMVRGRQTATLLLNGKALITGGSPDAGVSSLSSAELYDSTTGIWTATGSMGTARDLHTTTLLLNGQVLVAGGASDGNSTPLSSAELYDSASGAITLANLVKPPGGVFQFVFTGAANGKNTVLATANPASSLANWTVLGLVPEFSPGLYLFSDGQASNDQQRFYAIRSP